MIAHPRLWLSLVFAGIAGCIAGALVHSEAVVALAVASGGTGIVGILAQLMAAP